MNKKLIRKMLTASGGPIQKEVLNAVNYVKDYYNSPGFTLRFHKLKPIIRNIPNSPIDAMPGEDLFKTKYIAYKMPLRLRSINYSFNEPHNAKYDNSNWNINMNSLNSGRDNYNEFGGWEGTAAHEAGHAIDNSIDLYYTTKFDLENGNKQYKYLNHYSDIYPIFKNSKKYKEFKNSFKNLESLKFIELFPSGKFVEHDAQPKESYGDLMELRYFMNKYGIYDSRKKDNIFLLKHLDDFRKKNKYNIRLFDNFSDDDIIWMMNNVAKNNNKNLNILYNYYAKQGGKMNILEFLKNGSGIHIKKKNKGSFTRWCGGNVTSECILRGKNSSNPKIRKKATFADNARHFKHRLGGSIVEAFKLYSEGFKKGGSIKSANARKWKHKEGGIIKADEGTKFLSKQWFKNAGNDISSFLSSDTGKGLLDLGKSAFSGYTDYKNTSNLLNSLIEQNKADLEQTYNDAIQEALLNKILRQLLLKNRWQQAYLNGETLDNYSPIVASNVGWKEYSNSIQNANQIKNQKQNALDEYSKQVKSNMTTQLAGNFISQGLGYLGKALGAPSSTTV